MQSVFYFTRRASAKHYFAALLIIPLVLALTAPSAHSAAARRHSLHSSLLHPRLKHAAAAVLAVPALPSTPVPPMVLPWDPNTQGSYVMCMTSDTLGRIWVGTEDEGVWMFDRLANPGHQWTQFTSSSGLGDDNCYALACDRLGRVWAGTQSHGVAVFDGDQWKSYGPLNGPLGSRVFAIATSPRDGDVWMATEAGLARYALATDAWTYYGRSEGLPSDQAQAIAFDSHGNIFVGTDCDGIAIGSAASGFRQWRTIAGPAAPVASAVGAGLPTALIDALLVARDGVIYAGTTTGLARSDDDGVTWRYQRGADWRNKLAGLYQPVPAGAAGFDNRLLSEDYITSLAEDANGSIWVGHRSRGFEVLAAYDVHAAPRVGDPLSGDYIETMLPLSNGTVLLGKYGGGVTSLRLTNAAGLEAQAPLPGSMPAPPTYFVPAPAFPAESKATSLAALNAILAQIGDSSKLATSSPPVSYLGDDWCTKGDWLGRYGRQDAILWATSAPWNDIYDTGDFVVGQPWHKDYDVMAQIGPHHYPGDDVRHWVQGPRTENVNSLYNPGEGYRIEAEIDDHGEAYPQEFEGPDLWVTVQLPAGTHRVSFYFFNKDGHDDANRYRDYLIEWKRYAALSKEDRAERLGLSPPQDTGPLADLPAALLEPTLARARVRNFRGGVYKQFFAVGPAKYLVRISKNYSHNTICPGTFIDTLTGSAISNPRVPLDCMGDVYLDPPDRSIYRFYDYEKMTYALLPNEGAGRDSAPVVGTSGLPSPLKQSVQIVDVLQPDASPALASIRNRDYLLALRAIPKDIVWEKASGAQYIWDVSGTRDNWMWNLCEPDDRLTQIYQKTVKAGFKSFATYSHYSPSAIAAGS